PRVTAPPLAEELLTLAVMFFLAFGLPTEWFSISNTEVTAQAEGGALAALFFGGLMMLVITRLNGNWRVMEKVVGREPLLAALIVFIVASTLWSARFGVTFRRSSALALTTLFGYYLATRYDVRKVMRMVAFVLATGLIIQIAFSLGVPQYGQAVDTRAGTGASWTGTFLQKNQLGRIAAFATIVFALTAREDRRRRTIWYSCAGMSIVVLLGSNSKTALVAAGLVTAMAIVFQAFRARRTLYGAVAITMVGGAAAGMAITATNLASIASYLGRDITLSGRTDLWEDLWTVAAERPILGAGWNAFWTGYFSPSHEIWVQNDWLPPHAHNGFFDYYLEIGLLGLTLFALLYARSAIRAARLIQVTPGVMGLWPLTMLSFALISMVTEQGMMGRTIYWAVLVMMIVQAGAHRSPKHMAQLEQKRRARFDAWQPQQ
ncbi:MAG: O-antigen ligase family protein, partial [Acidimicrobiales bacterium]|nr:O-antigen ligase family protein [Acidimicrobiales bacterium]